MAVASLSQQMIFANEQLNKITTGISYSNQGVTTQANFESFKGAIEAQNEVLKTMANRLDHLA